MSDTIQSVKDLPEVSFIDNDTLEAMKTRMVANFESEWKRITGQEITLSPSDPEKERDFTFEREDLADGTVVYHVNTSGLLQRYTFTEI